MALNNVESSETAFTLRPVGSRNWRDVAKLQVTDGQRVFVAEPSYYLALCCYGTTGWQPLAVHLNGQVIGFLMWAIDPADTSCWLGGIIIDRAFQGRGFGTQAVQEAIAMLSTDHHYRQFALSYDPANLVAKHVYARFGFIGTGEREADEVVAGLSLG